MCRGTSLLFFGVDDSHTSSTGRTSGGRGAPSPSTGEVSRGEAKGEGQEGGAGTQVGMTEPIGTHRCWSAVPQLWIDNVTADITLGSQLRPLCCGLSKREKAALT